MTKIPKNIYIPPIFIEKYSHTNKRLISHKDQQYTHTQQLIEKLEGKKERKSTAYCIAIDDVIKMLRGDE